MKRTLWIVGLAFALVVYAGGTLACIADMIASKHLKLDEVFVVAGGMFFVVVGVKLIRHMLKESAPRGKQTNLVSN